MKKCNRCGCFFIGTEDVCANCIPNDNNDKAKLTDYCLSNSILSFPDMIDKTGVTPANLSRYLSSDEFAIYSKKVQKENNINL